jgi:transposase InsO family protein
MDFVGVLPRLMKETQGKDYDMIMVMIDKLTKYAYFELTTTNVTVPETVKIFMEKIIAQYGQPEKITLDRDKLFMSKFWGALIEQMGIEHRLSTAYHLQTNGQTERTNQTMEIYLRHYVNYQ